MAEAARLADEVGYEDVTLAALADHFGVAVPSLYKHVGGIDDVRRRVAVQSIQEFGGALTAALPEAPPSAGETAASESGEDPDRGTWLRFMADAYRAYAREHPGRYAATVRAPAPEDTEHIQATEAVLTTVLTLLDRYGLAGDDAIDAARAVRSALHGFIALEAAGGFGLPRDVERSYARLVAVLHTALSEWGKL